jgi:Rrf2 family protein
VQISKGVEWAVHCCTVLALVPQGRGLSADALSEFFEVPGPYLAKQMQALSRAGLLESMRGKHGGYRLAQPVDAITLLDIVTAIEGPGPAFRCTEIRQNGPCAVARKDCRRPCEVASAFADAEAAWRDSLRHRSLASIMQEAVANSSPDHLLRMVQWVGQKTD